MQINAKAQEILDQITPGTVLDMPAKDWIEPATVSHLTEKSVYFTDGEHTAKRSLHNFRVVSQPA